MAQLTLVYHFKSYYKTLEKSINSLVNQTNQDFDLILIDDGMSSKTREIINKFNLSAKFKNLKFISIDKPLGHTYCFNAVLENFELTPYIYFLSPGVVYKENFVETITNIINENKDYDVICFDCKNVFPKDINEVNELTKNKIIYPYFTSTYTNKIYSKRFINEHKLRFASFHHYTTLWNFQTFLYLKSLRIIHEPIAKLEWQGSPSYNLYDLINQVTKIINQFSEEPVYTKNKDVFDYIFIRLVLYRFLTLMYNKFVKVDKHIIEIAINRAINLLDDNIPGWKENKFLSSKKNPDDPNIIKYLKNFDKKLKSIKKIAKDIGYGKW